jgi:hypothetical protein
MTSFPFSCCKRLSTESETFEQTPPIHVWGDLVTNTDLTDIQKQAIRVRVLSVVKRLRDRLFRLSISYTILRTTTTVGSLLVPSLLAVQSNVDVMASYWAMWGIGLSVSLSNAFVSLFRVDKNYFTVGDLIEKIESEAWMYLTLSGKYKRDDLEDLEEGITGHKAMFSSFMERCEMMMNKAIRTEYIPGQVPSGSRSFTNDHHSLMGKRANISTMPRSNDPYEIVPKEIDDKHNRSASGSSDTPDNIRQYRTESDSTIESGGVPDGKQPPPKPGVVSPAQGSQGIQIRP